MRMHDDQVDITVPTVAGLVAAQFPQWRGLGVRPVASGGTVNALFRVGAEVVLRFPLRPGPGAELRAEQENARLIAPRVGVAVPEPLGLGRPGDGYPGWWAAYRWIPGEIADPAGLSDPTGLAHDLAGFSRQLQAISVAGRRWDGHSRGGPLHRQNEGVQESLAASRGLTDTARLARIWAGCRDVPLPADADRWIHADLMPGNLLVRDGRLVAVIDLGTLCVGDPAVDLMPAWNLLPPVARQTLRAGVDDATWERGRGWALVQAISSLWYYQRTNPAMAATAGHTLTALLTS
jgi:aminoglycoside phosphotransferase (APT) family kinase protein